MGLMGAFPDDRSTPEDHVIPGWYAVRVSPIYVSATYECDHCGQLGMGFVRVDTHLKSSLSVPEGWKVVEVRERTYALCSQECLAAHARTYLR